MNSRVPEQSTRPQNPVPVLKDQSVGTMFIRPPPFPTTDRQPHWQTANRAQSTVLEDQFAVSMLTNGFPSPLQLENLFSNWLIGYQTPHNHVLHDRSVGSK